MVKQKGSKWSQSEINAVWEKGLKIAGLGVAISNFIKQDACGATIRQDHYGNRNSQHGWEIDHIIPISKGGTDDLNNLRPLHWKNNVATSDNGYLVCVIS